MPKKQPSEKPKRKRGTGRPPGRTPVYRCTPEVIEKVAKLVEGGLFLNAAFINAEVSAEVGYTWLGRGRAAIEAGTWPAKEQPYVDLVQAVDTAKHKMVGAATLVIRKAMQQTLAERTTVTTQKADGTVTTKETERHHAPDWRAADRLLQVHDPDNWGKQRHEVTGKDGGPVKVEATIDLSGYTDDQLADLERILANPGRSQDGASPA